jgi:hypothetical protein
MDQFLGVQEQAVEGNVDGKERVARTTKAT